MPFISLSVHDHQAEREFGCGYFIEHREFEAPMMSVIRVPVQGVILQSLAAEEEITITPRSGGRRCTVVAGTRGAQRFPFSVFYIMQTF